jgi:hypothetical protein
MRTSRAPLWALFTLIVGCPSEPALEDASVGSIDAPGLDAPGLDAPGLDAPGLDASGDHDANELVREIDAARTTRAARRGSPSERWCARACLSRRGVQQYDVPPVEDSFDRAPPPAGTTFEGEYSPRPGECSVRQHDRYWVRARDGRVYRTWHPPSEPSDVETGRPCTYGHEHGADPRSSPLYTWAGGVPFGITGSVAPHYRHTDHTSHKVFVQNLWEAAVGNGPSDDPYRSASFHCHWLSKVHQDVHDGFALGNNEHEYQNNIMCDDGFARHPLRDYGAAGPDRHTRASVRALTTWGRPGEMKACDAMTITTSTGMGREPVMGSDTNREIKCATPESGWLYAPLPREIVSETGHTDFARDTRGIDELWKPWLNLRTRDGRDIFVSSAYYVVRNPPRVYNPLPSAGGYLPRRDWDGDGIEDEWVPTLEVCFDPRTRGMPVCAGLPESLASLSREERWLHVDSPFDGTIRLIHPKGTMLANETGREHFCTSYTGFETDDDPMPDGRGWYTCPEGQLLQYVASTQNLWGYGAAWGASPEEGHVGGSMVNARAGGTIAPGYSHEWVFFFDAPGVHAPN